MAQNDPRLEFRPPRELREKIESLRKELSLRAGKRISTGETLIAIVEEFFSMGGKAQR